MKKQPIQLRVLAALKLRAMTIRDMRESLVATDNSVRDAVQRLCDAGLVEKRCQVPSETTKVPAWLYGLTP